MSKIFNINLDVRKNNYICLSGFKVGDNLSTINGTMLQSSVPYNLTGLTLRANFKDSQGNLYFQDSSKGVSIINPLEGTFKVDVLSSVLSVEGIIKADISIFKGTQKLTSSTFSMEVVETVYKDGAIVGEDGKDLLQGIVEGESKRINAEVKREANEVVREKGEVKREEREMVREDNESKRKQGYSKMDDRIDNLVLGQGNITEVIDAHLDGVSNVKYPTLKARLDHTSKQLFDSSLSTLTTSDSITTLENSVDGLMQIDSIKGKTLQNLIANSDFSKGASNWVGESGSTLSINGNVGMATGNGSTKHLGIAQFPNPSFFVPTHKIYSRMMVRITDVGADVKPEIALEYRDASLLVIDKIRTASQNTWYALSGVTPIVGYENPYIRAIVFYETANVQKGRVLQVKDAMTVDLTQMFGTGNEPTKEWCDSNLSYFDGIKSTGEEFSDVNLFDKTKVTSDSIVSKDGTVKGGNTGWYATDFISVKEGMEIRFNKVTGSTGAGLGLYNKNTLISWMSNTDLNAQGLKVRIPKGVNYIRASNHITSITVDNFIINQEEYKTSILSRGKNLFNKNNIVDKKTLEALTGKISDHPFGYVSDYINVNQNTDYTIAKGMGSGAYGHGFYNSDKVFISGILASAGQNTPQKITTPINTSYIKLCGLTSLIDSQQFEKGTISTQYEPYKEDKIEILLDSPLRSLQNGISDEIVGDKLVRRIGKVFYTGNETWRDSGVSNSNYITFDTNITVKSNTNIICNNFKVGIANDVNSKEESILCSVNYKVVYIRILKSKLSTPDVTGFKKWLSENNTELFYELAEPVITTINPSSLKSFKNGSIILNNLITPIVDLKYPTSIGGRLSSVENTLDDTVDRVVKLWLTMLQVADKELQMKSISLLTTETTTDLKNKLNEIINIWR